MHPTNMLQKFLTYIHKGNLIQKDETTLLAVSGGVDSVVMSFLFYEAKLKFAIAHCNFGLRGEASQKDERGVEALAQQYQIGFYRHSFDVRTYAKKKKLSIQMAARVLRYRWFLRLLEKYAFDKLATAHHRDDSVETFLLNLIKGTGIAGLHGILPKRGKLIRPLLFADKAMILHYAQEKSLLWHEDSSNCKNHYQRNLIRNKVIPLLKMINPNLATTFKTTTEKISQVEAVFNTHVASMKKKLIHFQPPNYYVELQHIKDKPWAPMVAFEILQPFGFNFLQIKALFSHPHQSGKMIIAAAYKLTVDRDHWVISPYPAQSSSPIVITTATKSLQVGTQCLRCAIIPYAKYRIAPQATVAALDLRHLTFPLTLRKWCPGDFFYPLGMQQRKKLSNFLIDLKIPMHVKEHVYVVTSSDKIAWVMGYRIDDRFKITARTQAVYELRLL